MHLLSAAALTQLFKSGKVSAQEIAEFFIKRANHFDPQLKAFLALFPDQMMKKAKLLDEKRKNNQPLGKLASVPFAIKDNIHIKGELTTCASKFLTNYRAPFNATVTRLLEEEDALFIGKTNMDEFAMGSSGKHSAFFPTKNPWDLTRSPGGSSSGSAAAVSARLCPLALGSDTGGSIRQPAAFSGIVGFKPTYGRISRNGLVAFGSSLDQIGPFATNVKDAALSMEIMAKHCSYDSTSLKGDPLPYTQLIERPIKGAKIGVPWKFLEGLTSDAKQNFMSAIEVYKSLGAHIVEVELDILKYSIAVYYILATAEASTNLARFDGIRYGKRSSKATTIEEVYEFSRQEGFGAEVKHRILLGTYVLSSGFHNAYYHKAQQVRAIIIQKMREAFSQCQMIAMPCAPTVAFRLDALHDPLEEYLQDLYTIGANLAGVPAISIPSGLNQDKIPFGFQLIGPQMHDDKVLQFAHAFEQATDHHRLVPPLFEKEALA